MRRIVILAIAAFLAVSNALAEEGVQHYAMYGRPFGKSLCHAWGASPVYLLPRYFLGVKPTKPGWEE